MTTRPLAAALALLMSVLLARHTLAQSPTPAVPLTLEAALTRALQANPAAAAAQARQRVDGAAIRQAGERPNPEGRLEFERETPSRAYTVGLPIETGGKRRSRVAAATAAYRVGEAEVIRLLFELRTEVRQAYVERVAAERRLTLLEEMRDLATRVRDTAQQRFTAGDVPRLEVVQADLALARSAVEVAAAHGTVTAARIHLNTLLALPQEAPTPLAPLPDTPPPAAGRLTPLAVEANTALVALDRQIDAQLARIALAKATQVPDMTPEVTVTRGAEPEFATGWRAGVAFSLPLFTRHRSGVQIEEAEMARLSLERQATAARVVGAVAASAAEAAALWDARQLLRRDALPRAEETEQLAQAAYELGQTGISSLLQALQAAREVRLQDVEATTAFHRALAELERAAGIPLP